ncbi:hypothetical protein ACLQ29_10825 [Micromonospora sp. DT228]|uniref:hypothetical protein n=1 Tax=Micromonospora sp. DT228 TaxID=3393443 RepID=UPI003CF7D3E3
MRLGLYKPHAIELLTALASGRLALSHERLSGWPRPAAEQRAAALPAGGKSATARLTDAADPQLLSSATRAAGDARVCRPPTNCRHIPAAGTAPAGGGGRARHATEIKMD